MKTKEVRTVLVIEDDPDIREFVSRVLGLDGYRVLQAEDVATGLKLARENRVCLIVLDLRLPKLDGWHFLEWRGKEPLLSVIPTVVLTASAGVTQREKALRMGATEYLVKPLSADQLKSSIDRIMKGRRCGNHER